LPGDILDVGPDDADGCSRSWRAGSITVKAFASVVRSTNWVQPQRQRHHRIVAVVPGAGRLSE
jgi:hypothetical protein